MQNVELPRENVFGHTKKISLILDAIRAFQRKRGNCLIRVLDFGCGNGSAITRYLAQLGGCVTGVDVHPESIEFANNHFGSPQCKFVVSDERFLSDQKEKFDIIVFSDVLEHVEDPHQLLLMAAALLSENGRILVSIPNGRGPFEIESFMSRLPFIGKLSMRLLDYFVAVLNKFVFKDAWNKVVDQSDTPYNADSGHVQFLTKKVFLAICKACNLQMVGFQNLSFLSGPYTNYCFAPSKFFCKWNTSVTKYLSHWMVSAWLFELTRS